MVRLNKDVEGLRNFIYIFLIVLTALFFNLYRLNSYKFFFADDWAWLYSAEFRTFSDIFTLIPHQIYNDRPIGAIVVKTLYSLFGLNSRVFLFFLLGIHILNCILIYFISKPYVSRFGSALTAILAATWISSNNAVFWTAAIFDLFGTTLCLLTLLAWQLSQNRNNDYLFNVFGALFLFFAIRTKEFSILLVLLMLVMNVVLNRRKVLDAILNLRLYLLVAGILGIRYVWLLYTGLNLIGDASNRYGLMISGVFANTIFYLDQVFYVDIIGTAGVFAICFTLLIGALISTHNGYRSAIVGFIGFLVLLGPVLLLSNQLNPLYLYAPHFFLAFCIGGLAGKGRVTSFIAVGLSLMLITAPSLSVWDKNNLFFAYNKSKISHDQFKSARPFLVGIENGTVIFISGVEPYFNAFSYGPGNSIKILTKDDSLKIVLEKPDKELISEFCLTFGPRLFIKFNNSVASDVTELISVKCKISDELHRF